MTEARDAYLRAMFKLSRANAAEWATFVEAFKSYAAEEIERTLTAASHDAQFGIGYGRRMRDMRNDIVRIESIPESLKK
jgi:hypothetical protein